MHTKPILLSLATLPLATSALAVPVDAFSEVSYQHAFTLNSGTMPAGLSFSLAGVLEVSRNADTELDTAVTDLIDVPSVQVGQVVADPPIPFFDRRGISETTPDGGHAARASYNVNVLQRNSEGSAPSFAIVSREVANEGAAQFTSADGTISGDGASEYNIRRSYGYENVSDTEITFLILGEFSAQVLAEYSGSNGFARSSLNYGLGIDPSLGVSITYLPFSNFVPDIEDGDPDAFVNDFFDIGETGFDFSASASASGSGESARASLDGGFRYGFIFTMSPGSSFILTDEFRQTNAVEYRAPDIAPVPNPASLSLLLAGMGALSLIARRRSYRFG